METIPVLLDDGLRPPRVFQRSALPGPAAIYSMIMRVGFTRVAQAYFFHAQPDPSVPADVLEHYSLMPATAGDESTIREQSQDLFGEVTERIANGELFLTLRAGACVGFGVLARSVFQRAAASIGMFTSEPFRGSGVASATIALLMARCRSQGLRAIAGCWYYNHASKRALERAGMVSRTRLLHVEY